ENGAKVSKIKCFQFAQQTRINSGSISMIGNEAFLELIKFFFKLKLSPFSDGYIAQTPATFE
ncbi:MAG: hypothetical protein ACLUVC_16310, partial [Longibaculum sp.]